MSISNNRKNGALAVLGVLLVGLKLYGVIGWTWPWVTAPFWLILARYLLSLAVTGLVWLYARSMIRGARRREMQDLALRASPKARAASATQHDPTLPAFSPAAYAAGDDTPTRSHCSSHGGGHGDHGYSGGGDSSCSSSSDGGDSGSSD